jgi:PAP2 superfamily
MQPANARPSLKPRYWHYGIGLLLMAALVPLMHWLHLPFDFEWKRLAVAYWLVLAAQSVVAAILLCLIGLSPSATIGPLMERWRREPSRILLVLFYCAALLWLFGWMKALVLTLDTIALVELLARRGKSEVLRGAMSVLLPASYFFIGFLLILAYNCVIVSVRFPFAYDPVFNAADKWILHGRTVSDLSHWALQTFPLFLFRFLEFIYFGMFFQIGAAIILVSLCCGWHRGMQLVGTILMAYYLALGIFYLWPSQGPYYLCPSHFSRFPAALESYHVQRLLMAHALALWNHVPIYRISTDYFIAFPCMHIAQPLIVLWFLRRWRRMTIALCVYDVLLIGSILLLELHYLVDVLAGFLVAGAAIVVTAAPMQSRKFGDLRPREGGLSIS